jgi:CSLREA domain-containing protein
MDYVNLKMARIDLLRFVLIALLACGALLIHAPPARAATFIVTRTDDPAPNGCVPADCSLREAIIAANAATGTDSVSLPFGTYLLAITGTNEDASSTGDLDVSGTLLLTGAGIGKTIIDGQQIDRVLDLRSGELTISNMTIQHGQTTPHENGGGIRSAGALTIVSSAIISNTAGQAFQGGDGGGIYSTNRLHIADSLIEHNISGGNGGGLSTHANTTLVDTSVSHNYGQGSMGGIDNTGNLTITTSLVSENESGEGSAGGISNTGHMNIRGSTITKNNASDGSGGGIFNIAPGVLDLVDSHITYNQGSGLEWGGGGILNTGTLTATGSSISYNSIGAWSGGGIANRGTATVRSSTIAHNSSGEYGGGIGNTGMLLLEQSAIISNQVALDGAAIEIESGGVITLINSTISGNSAHGQGGGIDNHGSATINNATITNNQSPNSGAGIASDGSVSIGNTILAGNRGFDCGGSLQSHGHNLIGDITGCTFTAAPGDLAGSAGSPLDPQLGPLATPGGATPSHTPIAGSPAINAGDNATCAPFDQRNLARPQGPTCDIGAIERGWLGYLPLITTNDE